MFYGEINPGESFEIRYTVNGGAKSIAGFTVTGTITRRGASSPAWSGDVPVAVNGTEAIKAVPDGTLEERGLYDVLVVGELSAERYVARGELRVA